VLAVFGCVGFLCWRFGFVVRVRAKHLGEEKLGRENDKKRKISISFVLSSRVCWGVHLMQS
jgi:hypothetical protein